MIFQQLLEVKRQGLPLLRPRYRRVPDSGNERLRDGLLSEDSVPWASPDAQTNKTNSFHTYSRWCPFLQEVYDLGRCQEK